MGSHRTVHSILEASLEVTELSRRRGFTTVELTGAPDGPFRESSMSDPAASVLMDITDPYAQARLELLQPGQRIKMYLELEHDKEAPPVIMSGYYPLNISASSTTAVQIPANL